MLNATIIILKFIKTIIGAGLTNLHISIRSAIRNLTYKQIGSPKNVLVIGASFAGCQAAKLLAKSLPAGYRVILVEKSSHFQFTWVFPRFSVVPDHEHKAFIPYDHIFDGAPDGSWTMMQDTVTSIDAKTISLDSGRSLDYEYLVIATGSKAGAPSRLNVNEKSEGISVFKSLQQSIANADNLVVVGGGPAGVEVACDAKSAFPGKTVTLVHSRQTLLHYFGYKLHTAAQAALNELGVRLILNDRVEVETEKDVKLKSGERIPCDMLIRCTGQKAASEVIADLSPDSISPSGGYIKVKNTLQIADDRFGHIYAAGDVADSGAPKNGRSATAQAAFVSDNILRAVQGRPPLVYRTDYLMEGGIELTLGLDKNVFYATDGYRDTVLAVKSKEIALKSASCWKRLGAKPFVDGSSDESAMKI